MQEEKKRTSSTLRRNNTRVSSKIQPCFLTFFFYFGWIVPYFFFGAPLLQKKEQCPAVFTWWSWDAATVLGWSSHHCESALLQNKAQKETRKGKAQESVKITSHTL